MAIITNNPKKYKHDSQKHFNIHPISGNMMQTITPIQPISSLNIANKKQTNITLKTKQKKLDVFKQKKLDVFKQNKKNWM